MAKVINPALIGNWENWFRILLMVLIGFVAFDLVTRLFTTKEGK